MTDAAREALIRDLEGRRHASYWSVDDHLLLNRTIVALRTEQVAPVGWKLVPERPTERQMDAGLYQSSADSKWEDVYSIYADMIDVAPAVDDHPDELKPSYPVGH